MNTPHEDILSHTAMIAAAHLGHNSCPISEVPQLIQSTYAALAGLGDPVVEPAQPLVPAVPINRSIKPDHIVCLEDGTKLKMLKRYLRTHFNLSPDQYRAKWNLPHDYPMTAPNYSAQRTALAHKHGLGVKPQPAAM